MAGITLKGITWGHSRGITPLLAVSQRYAELHPGIEIQWQKRSLQEFADYPIEKLTERYDLLIIDHPWVGCAASTKCVLPLEEYLSASYLQNQLENSVGGSHESYHYNGHQWALAIDAATPAASFRKDLFEKNGIKIPSTWADVMSLAKKDRVAVPAIPIDLLMNFYTFCIAHGNEPFGSNEIVIDEHTGLQALETMKAFYSLVDKNFFTCNPIAVAELMSSTDQYWYCPFAYCYSNYSRNGFGKHLLTYSDVVFFRSNQRLRTTIGGTGLAVSAFSEYKKIATDFAAFIVSEECQSGLYVQHGGQPGHKTAWESEEANQLTHDFFKSVSPSMEKGYIRPRYNGYLHFQDRAGEPLQQFLMGNGTATNVLKEMNHMYRQSLATNQTSVI